MATTYRKPHPQAVFSCDVIVRKEWQGDVLALAGMIEKFSNQYGVLYWTSQFGKKHWITVGPSDMWVLEETGLLYWMQFKIELRNPPPGEELRACRQTAELG